MAAHIYGEDALAGKTPFDTNQLVGTAMSPPAKFGYVSHVPDFRTAPSPR